MFDDFLVYSRHVFGRPCKYFLKFFYEVSKLLFFLGTKDEPKLSSFGSVITPTFIVFVFQ